MSTPPRLITAFWIAAFTILFVASCNKQDSLEDAFFYQDVRYRIAQEEIVLNQSQGCRFIPEVNVLVTAQFFADQVVLRNGIEYDFQYCDNNRARTYIQFTSEPSILAEFSTTRDFIFSKIENKDYSSLTHNIEICNNGERYIRSFDVSSTSAHVAEDNFIKIMLNDRPSDCSIISGNTIFVDFKFDGFLYNANNAEDSLRVNFPESRYYFPY